MGQSATGICTDLAGNTASDTQTGIKIDKTGPTAVLTPSGTLGTNGWFVGDVTITTSGTDSLSTPVTCTAGQSQTTDTPGTVFNGSCINAAGLTTDAAPLTVKRDTVVPSVLASANRAPDFNGWYNNPVTINFSGTDATSGIAACDPAVLYSGPNSATASVTGFCTDVAGNSNSASSTFKYNGSGPIVTLTASGTLGTNGWYTSNVTITTAGTDPLGPVTCTGLQFQTTDTTGKVFNGSCTNSSGLTTDAAPLTVKRDTVNPAIAYLGRTAANGLGWNNTNVTANWSCTDATSGPVSPAINQTLTTEGAGQSASATCVDNAGNTSATSTVNNISIDKTLPVITMISRSPAADNSGWNYAPVTVTWDCVDAVSGAIMFSPIPQTLSDAGAGQVATSTCQDRAGNLSTNTVEVNIFLSSTIPPVLPTATAVVPPTAVPPTETQAPAPAVPSATQPVEPTATPTETQIAPVTGAQSGGEQLPVTGQDTGSTSGMSRFLLFGVFGLAGLGFLSWLLFLLFGKRRHTQQK
jgi:hypothetical protein